MASRAQLVREVMKELGVHQAGQDLPPEDYRAIDERLPFEVAALASAGIYSLDDINSIPDDAVLEMARYIAGNNTNVFGLAGEELQAVLAKQAAAEQALRYLNTRGPTYTRQRAEYF